jgi:hypothetical protein
MAFASALVIAISHFLDSFVPTNLALASSSISILRKVIKRLHLVAISTSSNHLLANLHKVFCRPAVTLITAAILL